MSITSNNLQIDILITMSPSEPEILAALASYREHIGSLTYHALSDLIPKIEAAEPDDPDDFTEDEIRECLLEAVLCVVGENDVIPPITCPTDVLTHWKSLAPQLALDGAAACHDTAWRDEMRAAYTRGVLRGLNERCQSELVAAWEFPADLAVVLQHVDSLEGNGWYRYREHNETVVFLEGWRSDAGLTSDGMEEIAAGRVRTPAEIAEVAFIFEEEYEIAGGWACGEKGNEASCYVAYSRPRDGGEERKWSWRYVASLGQYGEEFFEDVVGLLNWYKSYDEPRESDWDVFFLDIFSGCP
ncbi:uncharacterized protein PG998_002722 [Apiospora kogelbergensis]|uniref:uncharacterized protein n=1 Tax=Apiospora kogelbergensis TaxID=1337665 RepID=UPI00313201A2